MPIDTRLNSRILMGLVALLGSVALTACVPSAKVPIRGPQGDIEGAPSCCELLCSQCGKDSYCKSDEDVEENGILYATCHCQYDAPPASEGSPDFNMNNDNHPTMYDQGQGNDSGKEPKGPIFPEPMRPDL